MTKKTEPDRGAEAPVEEMPYDIAYQELEEIVAALENNDHTLEDALALYERGQVLARRCAELLDTAELRVRDLSG